MNLNKYDLHQCVRRLPHKFKGMMKKHGPKIVVAGGYIRSVVSGERISDVDVFAGNKEASGIFATELQGADSYHKTDNAFTVTGLSLPVQFIFRWVYDHPVAVVDSFDFTICQAAFWYNTEVQKWDSVCSDRFYQDVAAHRIIYLFPVRNEDAGGSMLRVFKYYQRGYRIPLDSLAGVMSRLYMAIDLEAAEAREDMPFSQEDTEKRIAHVLAGLLFEVDPNAFIDHEAYLPASEDLEAQ